MSEQADVVVVGAGLAGLVCAADLQRRGLETVLLESAERVGGRVATDVVDGFRCDVGFQLLNPAYPAVGRLVDTGALGLRSFRAGVHVRRGGAGVRLGDPRRAPGLLLDTLRSGMLDPRELAGLARWLAPVLAGRPGRRTQGADATLSETWDRLGVDGPLRHRVLEPFLSGVLADDSGGASDRYVRLVVRSFLLGVPGVPAEGMQALPAQLASRLLAPPRLGTPVRAVSAQRVSTDAGDIRAGAVVVATDGPAAHDLDLVAPVRTGGLTTWWWSVPEPLGTDRLLRVDGEGGPVANTADLSAVAPSYAPAGRSLVQATALSHHELGDDDVRAEMSRLWDTDAARWELVVRHHVPHALPLTAPPLRLRPPLAARDEVVVTGDHRETPSLQGALVAGRRAAQVVVSCLR